MYLTDSELVDGVVIGRALLSDPEFVNKAQAGRIDEIAPCASCGIGCIGEQTKRRPASCVINPALGREAEMELLPAKEPKKVAVVGGGIGGMASARAFALCGHQVTLFEESDRLGGQMNAACIPPHKQELSRWIVYLQNEIARLGIPVKCGVHVMKETLEEYKPDIVIIATGAKEIIPPISGIEKDSAITAQKVLNNEVPVIGGNVLVVGGGMVGCEVCEHLMHQKRGALNVTMIEMADAIGAGMVPNNQLPTMNRLHHLGIRMMTGTKLLSVNGNGAEVESPAGIETMTGFTHIIYACGSRAENKLYEEVKDSFEKVICIGDAKGARQALEAVREGWEAALEA